MKRLTLCMMVVAAMLTVDTSMAGLDKQESQLRLELDLDDGSHIIGIPSIESIPVQTSYAKMDIALKQILIIKIADHETTSINLLNGDKLNGTIKTEPIRLETVFGKVSVAFEHIRELRVVPSGWGGFMTNAARDAKVEVNRSSPGNGLPEKVNDGVTNDVAQPYTSYWFAGEGPPKPDWIRLRFDKPALIRSIRILAPLGTIRFDAGHAPLDYEVTGLSGGREITLASVKNGEHQKTEPGPAAGVEWIVVELTAPKELDGVQLTCRRTSGGNHGPVIFEIQALGIR